LSKAVTALHENPFPAALESPVSDMLESLAPHVDGFMGFVFDNQWLISGVLVNKLSKDPVSSTLVRNTTGISTAFSSCNKQLVIALAQIKFAALSHIRYK
tara:strand:+ start:1157 stop:1456 length:300 start_codon:yes stop_codon:yes gene_type:complete